MLLLFPFVFVTALLVIHVNLHRHYNWCYGYCSLRYVDYYLYILMLKLRVSHFFFVWYAVAAKLLICIIIIIITMVLSINPGCLLFLYWTLTPLQATQVSSLLSTVRYAACYWSNLSSLLMLHSPSLFGSLIYLYICIHTYIPRFIIWPSSARLIAVLLSHYSVWFALPRVMCDLLKDHIIQWDNALIFFWWTKTEHWCVCQKCGLK